MRLPPLRRKAVYILAGLVFTALPLLSAQSTLPDPLRTLLSPTMPSSPVSEGSVQLPGAGTRDSGEASLNSGVYVDPALIPTHDTRAIHAVPSAMTEFEQLVANAMGVQPGRFGRSLFTSETTTYAPTDDTPLPAGAKIASGDELMVRIWGQLSFNGHLTVDRSGAIFIPQLGRVQVAGLVWDQIEEEMRRQTARLFRNFEVSVTPGRLHSIRIYVLGQATRPGSYTVSSLSTMVSALFVTGGPSANGTLRRIELRRDGRTLTTLDLYDLMLKADKSCDLPLLSGDVIYIPQVGPEVAVLGSVRTPAIYELKGGETLGDALNLAGGPEITASNEGLTLERLTEKKQRETLRLTLNDAARAIVLREGDIFHLAPMGLGYDRTVTLRGNVANPGRYSWHPGMRLSELMPTREALVTRNYWQHRNRLGMPVPMIGGEKVSSTGPGKALTGGIHKEDLVAVPVNEEAGASAIAAAAEENPAVSESAPAEAIEVKVAAPEIDWAYAVIERMDAATLRNKLLPFSPGKLVLDKDNSQDLVLEAGDVVTLFSQKDIRVPQVQQTRYVRVEGEVVRAGVYTLQPGETLRQLVKRAGGTTAEAYLYGAEFTRESVRQLQQQRMEEYSRSRSLEMERSAIKDSLTAGIAGTQPMQLKSQTEEQLARLHSVHASGRIVLHMKPTSEGTEALPEISLEDGDVLVVPPRPAVVNVIGSVYNQNAFLFGENRRVGDYLKLAGGPSRTADRKHLFLIHADGSVVSRAEHREFASLPIYPGDTLVVPERLLKVSGTRAVLDWAMLFSQMALGAAAINVLR
jgi:protein involved in polysaccharide export with SLBB domain